MPSLSPPSGENRIPHEQRSFAVFVHHLDAIEEDYIKSLIGAGMVRFEDRARQSLDLCCGLLEHTLADNSWIQEMLHERLGEERIHLKRATRDETDMMKVHGTGWCKVPNLDPTGRYENVFGYGNLVEKSENPAKKYVRWKERQKVWEKQREKMARREKEERKQREKMEERDWKENEVAMLWELLGWQERSEEIRRVTEAYAMAKEYRLRENCCKLNEEIWESGATWKLFIEENYANYPEQDGGELLQGGS